MFSPQANCSRVWLKAYRDHIFKEVSVRFFWSKFGVQLSRSHLPKRTAPRMPLRQLLLYKTTKPRSTLWHFHTSRWRSESVDELADSVRFPLRLVWFHSGKMSSEPKSINKKPHESCYRSRNMKWIQITKCGFCRGRKESLFCSGICHIIQSGRAQFASSHDCGNSLDYLSSESLSSKNGTSERTSRERLMNNVLLHVRQRGHCRPLRPVYFNNEQCPLYLGWIAFASQTDHTRVCWLTPNKSHLCPEADWPNLNNASENAIEEVVSGRLQVNSGGVHPWCEQYLHRSKGAKSVFRHHFLCWWLEEKSVSWVAGDKRTLSWTYYRRYHISWSTFSSQQMAS